MTATGRSLQVVQQVKTGQGGQRWDSHGPYLPLTMDPHLVETKVAGTTVMCNALLHLESSKELIRG